MNSLGLDYKLLIAQLINFGLFYLIFKRFISKPFRNFLDIEVQKEKEKQRVLEELKKKEEEMLTKEKKFNKKMTDEMDQSIKQAKFSGEKVKEDIVQQARGEAEDILEKAHRQIEEERQHLYKDVRARITDFSLVIVNEALKDVLSDDIRKKITDYILNTLAKKIKIEN